MQKSKQMKKVLQLALAALLCLAPANIPAVSKAAVNQVKSDRVTLSLKNVSVDQLFSQIKKQTGYNFVSSSDLTKSLPKVNVTANNEPVKSVLERVLSPLNCSFDIDEHVITVYRKVTGTHNRTISGYVRDENGEVLPGVPICIGDSRVCTITDENGYYTFKIPSQACDLKFTYVGMKTMYAPVKAGNSAVHLDVKLYSDNALEEVVVTGYQDISKPKMTGAVTTINSDKLQERYSANIMNNLEGMVAGLSTYGGKIKIRGTSSLYAETSPLLVVDGVPVESSIEDLNPYEIESINVLKDAAATAIYGARASNGIIVVTTKNANRKGKVDVDFSTDLTIYDKLNVDYHDNFFMNTEEQVEVEKAFYSEVLKDPMALMFLGAYMGGGMINVSPIAKAYYQNAMGAMSNEELDAFLDRVSKNNYAKEYRDNIMRQQIMQQYNISLRSRSEKSTQNFTMNYRHDSTNMRNSYDSEYNFNYKGSFDVTKWLNASFNVNSILNKTKSPQGDASLFYGPFVQAPYESLFNEDGSIRYYYPMMNEGNDMVPVQEGLEDTSYSLLEEIYRNVEKTKRTHNRFHGNLTFKLLKGLSANTQFIYENSHTTTDILLDEKSHAMRTMRNAYAVKNPDGSISHLIPSSGGMRKTKNIDGQYWTFRGQLNFSRTFGKHDIVALAGVEFRQTQTNGTTTVLMGYDDQLQVSSSNITDFGVLSTTRYSPYYMSMIGYPAWQYHYSYWLSDAMQPVTEERHRYASGYANLTYTYDEKYNIFGSVRKDYADVYGLNAKFRGTPLWSVGAGWLIHNEAFMKDVKWVNNLKLRASYGVTGNIYQGATSYMTSEIAGINEFNSLVQATISSPANPNLKWEQSRTTNIGVDFSLLNNRLRGALDYYNKVGKDIFSRINLDPTTGFSSLVANSASMKNNGIELQLTYDWLRSATRNGFAWTTSFTLSHNKNEITKVENDATMAYQMISSGYKEGYPVSALWSYRFAGISDKEGEAGSMLWYGDDDAKVSSIQKASVDALVYSGQREPKVVMGMDNRLSWRGFSLNILMAYYGGHKMRALQELNYGYSPMLPILFQRPINSYYLNAWTPENPTNTPGFGIYGSQIPYNSNQEMNTDRFVRDADFLKIRNIVLAYDMPSQWLKPLGLQRVSLRFQIDNPKYLWVKNKVDVDPETLGVRRPSSYIFGVNVNF